MSLYIVPTPIGNLGDITRRAVDVLSGVDFVIAEDSRYTLKLLSHLGIRKRIVSHYRPREEEQAGKIVALLQAGQEAALVTDSGTPTISDPGRLLVRRAIDAGISVIPLPGPTALVPALAASGLDPRRFLFLGFPPRGAGELRRFLSGVSRLPYTLVLYESPRRLEDLLDAASEVLGDREFALAKEISKKHEAFVRSSLGRWRQALAGAAVLGEMVLVVAGAEAAGEREEAPRLDDIEDLYAFFQERFGMGRNALKRILMKKKAGGGAG